VERAEFSQAGEVEWSRRSTCPNRGARCQSKKNASKSLEIKPSKQLATTQAGIKIQSLSPFTVSTVLDTNYRKTHVFPRTFDNAFFPPKTKYTPKSEGNIKSH